MLLTRTCDQCEYKAAAKGNLRKHIYSIHGHFHLKVVSANIKHQFMGMLLTPVINVNINQIGRVT